MCIVLQFKKEEQMNIHKLKVITALCGLLLGLGYLIIPKVLIQIFFGVEADVVTQLVARFGGGAVLGYFVLAWGARKAENTEERRAILLALFITFLLGLALSVYGMVAGLFTAWGWIAVAVFGLIAIGFGYFRFSSHSKID